MEPRIQYVTTSDGVNIAYSVSGEGPALIWSQQPISSHVQREWQIPLFRAAISAYAAQRMVVRFDPRGAGLSDRDVDDFSLEARVRDLEAVVERLQLNEFSLLGMEVGGLPVIAYAANHPERVSHLVLVNCFASGEERRGSQRAQALSQLVKADWELFTESVSAQAFGFGLEESHQYAEFLRECITQEVFARMIEADEQIDLSGLLSQIQALTLVVRHSGLKLPMDVTRRLAAGIPNALLHEVEGNYQDNFVQFATTVFEFLGLEVWPEAERDVALAVAALGEAGDQPSLDSGAVHTILFTDVEGSTPLTQRLGDAKARELLREHERMVREALKAHGGSEVKTMGDGFMASFSSATKALECAIAIQQAFADRNESAGEPIKVRIGLNAGEPIVEDDPGGRGDLFGTAVNMAARIAAKAEAGEILVADVVRQLVAGKEFLFNDRGDTELRGFEDPVRVYEVRWREDG